jgi:hypothetical protein
VLAWSLAGLPLALGLSWSAGAPGDAVASARAGLHTGDGGGDDPVEDALRRRDRPLLTETVGLLMQVAVQAGDRVIFDQQVSRVRHHLLAPCGLLAWRATPDLGAVASSSAAIDDLAVVRALLMAADRWACDEARQLALSIAAAVARHEVVDGWLVDAASWEGDEVVPSSRIQTAYLALDVMARLAPLAPVWAAVLERSVGLLGELESPLGLFPEEAALPGSGAEEPGPTSVVNAILVLYCALHLALVGRGGERTLDFLRARWRADARLAGRYRFSDGRPIEGFESVAVHGLAARLARALGDAPLADQLLTRLLAYQLYDPVTASPAGPLPHRDTTPFDNLQALLALQQASFWRSR